LAIIYKRTLPNSTQNGENQQENTRKRLGFGFGFREHWRSFGLSEGVSSYFGEVSESALDLIEVSIDGVEKMIRWVAERWARKSCCCKMLHLQQKRYRTLQVERKTDMNSHNFRSSHYQELMIYQCPKP
jgi:hypothetical protein